jgi:nucleotide-binding universal stress UspA family protein
MKNGSIIVGVDGSPESSNALRWAVDEAKLRGAQLKAVHCWLYPVGIGIDVYTLPPEEVMESSAASALDVAIDAALEGVDGVPPIERVIVNGSPGHVLAMMSDDAELVVVGTRGHGGFTGLLMGSAANQVAHHAKCPAVLIHKESNRK